MRESASKAQRGWVLGPWFDHVLIATMACVVAASLVVIASTVLTYVCGTRTTAVVVRAETAYNDHTAIEVWFDYVHDGRDVRDRDQVFSPRQIRAGDRLEVRILALGPLRNAVIPQGHVWDTMIWPSVAVFVCGVPVCGWLLDRRRRTNDR